MTDSLSHKAARGTVWALADRMGSMVLQFVINLILARLLTPGDFGAVGMLAIFIAVSNVLIDGGFASALIQKKNATQQDWSTIFYWNLGISIFFYAVIFLASPYVANYFHMPVLSGVLRGIGLTLILGAMSAIQLNRLRKQFAFRTIAIGNLSAYVISGAVATLLAFSGFGVWSLVVMQVLQMLVTLLVFTLLARWLPSLCFSMKSLRALFGYGGYLLGANILQEIAKNLQGLIIGRRFSATAMGYYSQAYKLDRITSYSLPQVIVQVMFPLYSSMQDDLPALRAMLLRNVRVIAFMIFPVMGLLVLTAPSLIGFLYGDKWLPAVPYFRILCVAGMFACLQNINYYAVAARGKTSVLFMWSIYKWSFLLAALLAGAEIGGMDGIMWAMVLSEANIYFVNAALAASHTGLGFFRQMLAVLQVLCLVGVAFGAGWIVSLACGVLAGAGVFIAAFLLLACLLRLSALTDSLVFIKKIIRK